MDADDRVEDSAGEDRDSRVAELQGKTVSMGLIPRIRFNDRDDESVGRWTKLRRVLFG